MSIQNQWKAYVIGGVAALAISVNAVIAADPVPRMVFTPSSYDEALIKRAPRVTAANSETKTRYVSYADLNLSVQAGVDTLYQRIESASKKVCAPRERPRSFAYADWLRCYTMAMDGAVSQANVAILSAHHAAVKLKQEVEQREYVASSGH